jgi:hypothetical protein
MKRTGPLITAAALTMTLVPAAPASATHGCTIRGSSVVTRTSEAIVVRKGRPVGDAAAVLTYGCYYRQGSTYRLNQPSEFGPARVERAPVRLSGHFAAYVQAFPSAAAGDNVEVTVRSLISGRVIRRFSGSESASDDSRRVFGLVVKRNASAAWLSEDYGVGERPHEYQVHVADRTGVRRIIDRGEDIDPSSLTLNSARTVISWRHGGVPRSAPLD